MDAFVDKDMENEIKKEEPSKVTGEGLKPGDDSVKNAGLSAEEDKKRTEHEAAEAKRKEEWEAKQKAKKAAEQEQLNRLATMSDDDVMMASMKRVGTDTEKLTRRNMKECVSEYIQTKCLEDASFARLAMQPRKTMIHCFQYINRKAHDFIEQEIKDNDIELEDYAYSCDVPDGLCYQWAEDYFRDMDAKEDKEKEEEFVPKPYIGSTLSRPSQKKTAEKKLSEEKKEKPSDADTGQLSFIEQISASGPDREVKAG